MEIIREIKNGVSDCSGGGGFCLSDAVARRGIGAVHDVLLPSVANAFRCFMRLQHLNHDPPMFLLLFFSGTVKDSHTSLDC